MKHLTNARHGTGAAHIGFPMFGARGPCLDPEDKADKPGGSGSGEGDPPAPKDEDADDGDGGDDKRYTPAEVEEIVQKRLDRERRQQQKRQPAPKKPEPKSSKADTPDPTLIYEFQDALEAVVDETGVKLNADLKKRLRTLYVSEQPDDPDAWIKGWLKAAGIQKPPSPDNKQAKDDAVAASKKASDDGKPPISDKGSAASGGVRDPDQIALERPDDLTDADIERIYLKHGVEKGDELIRDRVNAYLRRIKLRADSGQRN